MLQTNPACTLTEHRVLIAIIAILLATISPDFAQARERAISVSSIPSPLKPLICCEIGSTFARQLQMGLVTP